MLIDSTLEMADRYVPGSELVGALTIKLTYRGPADYPYTAICYVESTFKDGTTIRGSGAMVGPNDVLTAGQMLWQAEHGGSAVSVKVIPGYHDGVAPFGSYQGALFSYYPIDQDGNGLVTHQESQWDVGIIGLSQNVGAQTGTFGIEWHPLHGVNSDPETVTLTGYPAGLDGAHGPRMMNDHIAVSAAGSANNNGNWTLDFATAGPGKGDVLPGDLGAPLWLEGHGSIHNGNNGPYIVGVDSTSSWAADVSYSFNQLMAWINGNDYLMH
jgi:V8-like Glu-specific endopeptidase